ncbi:MAG: PAS-domain containing protein, partial [Bdellovibrionales bacterium]
PGFARLFGKEMLSSHDGIQDALEPFDAASFETILKDYKKDPKPKDLIVQTEKGLTLELSFRWGETSDLHYHVIWARDISKTHKKQKAEAEESGAQKKEIRQLQNILDALPQAIWIRDAAGKITWVNQFYGDLFHKSKKQVLDEQKQILLKPKDSKEKVSSEALSKKALESGEIQRVLGHSIIDGKRYAFDLQEKPYPNLDITVGLVDDVTWQDEAQTENSRTVEAYHTIFGSLQTAVALYDANQKLEFYNSGFSSLWQLEESWLNQKPKLGDILEKLRETRRLPEQADFKSYKKEWMDMFTKLIHPHSDMMVLPDGTVLRTQVIPHPMGGVGHIFEDVTTSLELESSYNTLMAVQKETIDNLTEGVVVYGGDGWVKLCNNTFLEMWSLNPEEMSGGVHVSKLFDRTKDFFTPEGWADRKSYLTRVLEERLEESHLMKLTNGKIFNASSVPLPDGGTLLTYTDVSDTIRVEEALREKNTALETAEKLKTDFLAKISYQLRTPLSAMIGFNDLLDQEYFGALNSKQKEYTAGIQDAGRNLKNLIDDILDLTSLEAGIICLDTQETDVQSLLGAVHTTTQNWADSKQVKIDLKCPKTIGKVNIDQQRIKHAITHLVQNAINFTPEKGTVFLTAKRTRDKLLKITIQDTGKGIAQNDLDQVFKPFAQGEEMSGGAGLGLTIVKNIMELHNGTIDVKSAPDTGTEITLSFPL